MEGSNEPQGVSCPSASLCVASDVSAFVTSTDPTGGASAWTVSEIPGLGGPGAVSCPSVSLCVGVDGFDVASSTNPTGGVGAWRVSQVESAYPVVVTQDSLEGISCPSVSFCVAVDFFGDALTSTDPTGGVSAWTRTRVSPTTLYLRGVSCPSASLCVAVDGVGFVASSTDPSGGTSAWATTRVDPQPLSGVSCPSASLCVAVDSAGNAVVGSIAPAVVAGKPHVSGTVVNQALTCTGIHGAQWAVTLALTVTETLKGRTVIAVGAANQRRTKVSRKTVWVGAATVVLAAGQTKAVRVSLNPTGRALLGRYGSLKAKLATTVFGKTLATFTVVFRTPSK